MKNKYNYIKKYFLFPLSILCCILFFYGTVTAQEKNLVVIANSNGAPEKMTMKELKSIMKGEQQRWSNKVPIVVALMKSTTEAGVSTCKKIFEMNTNEFNKYWLAIVFQQKAKPPVFFHSSSELESFVAETPGAIGVIETSPSEKTGQIIIDGKKTF